MINRHYVHLGADEAVSLGIEEVRTEHDKRYWVVEYRIGADQILVFCQTLEQVRAFDRDYEPDEDWAEAS